MRVVILAEYYPRAGDPVSGIWAHRQAVAARDAGAEVRVLVLHRPLPPLAAVRALDGGAFARALRQPARAVLDGIEVRYLRYLSPPRPWSYGSWGLWAAPSLALALRRLRREFPFDLVHAHYAVPAGDAVRRVDPRVPLVVSVHGGDVYATSSGPVGGRAVRATLGHARLVLANSAGTARRCAEHGARATRVVHLGADLGDARPARGGPPTLVTVGHLIPRKRHADVVAALARLADRRPDLRYVIVGDGPLRERLSALARSLGVADRVELRGQLPPEQASARAREATLFVLPSVEEAFGVAYVEAMAGGVPAIGCLGEDGPEEIAGAGGGIVLVPRGDVEALAAQIDVLLGDPERRAALGREALATVRRAFTWEGCGRDTVAAYRAAADL
ncbi:MAG TPA: glycosyltransferase [Solirubrobacteraceae bacterium]|nr:glycosyltransferase [Solirubrobacteraceae bacterium]